MRKETRYGKGDKIGERYLVHKALSGGMGEVYLCRDLEEEIPIALKTFRECYLTNQRIRESFKREVAAWVALERHPNIVHCFYMNIIDNLPFMILEWVAWDKNHGTDLRSWLCRGALDLRLALNFTIDICRGLIHAQEKLPGIVHRDLKPGNILVAQGPIARITDFGLAKIVQDAELEISDMRSETDNGLSLRGKDGIVGTPGYMAPEQWLGQELDERTDIYAVGCILHEMLTGRMPFIAKKYDELRSLHLHDSIPKLSNKEMDAVVSRCMAKQIEERFGTVGELLDSLEVMYRREFSESPRQIKSSQEFTAYEYTNRGTTYNELKMYEKALEDFNRAILLDPNDIYAYNNRGNTYSELKMYEEALKDYNHAVEIDNNFALTYNNLGTLYDEQGKYEEALVNYNHAIQLDPNLTRVYSNRGALFEKLEKYEKALDDFNRAIELNPNFAHAYYNRGRTYLTLGSYGEALNDFNRAIEFDPNDVEIYNNRGLTYHKLRKYDKAIVDFARAIEIGKNFAQAYNNRGSVYIDLEKYEEALEDFNRAIKFNPNYGKAYYNCGLTYHKLGRYEEALLNYNRAVQLESNLIEVYNNRGETYRNMKRYEEALKDFNRAIHFDPGSAKTYYNRANIYFMLERYEKALTDYTCAIDLDPNNAHNEEVFCLRGLIYNKLGKNEEALEDLKHAIKLRPNYAEAHLSIGSLLAQQGELQQSLPYFEKAALLGNSLGKQYAERARQMLASGLGK